MVFGLWCSGHCLAGLPRHCLLQLHAEVPAGFGHSNMAHSVVRSVVQVVWSVVIGHSTKTRFKFQNKWSKSVPETVPERKPEPETTHSGTHSGEKNVVFAIPLLQQTFSTAESGPS